MFARRIRLVASCVLVVSFLASAASAQLTDVSPQNEAVNKAIEKAKETLPEFFARLAKPSNGDSGFLVKIVYPKSKGQGREHIWAKEVVKTGDTITATIANDPVDIANLKGGDRVTVPISQISDWLYVRNEKYVGAYTVRALLPYMEKAGADRMRKMLTDD